MAILDSLFSGTVSFEKWHGAGNDFLFVNLAELYRTCNADLFSDQWSECVVALCHRHVGLGADGVVVWTQDSANNRTGAAIWNSDGSRAQTCGNAVRCLGGALLEKNLWAGDTPLNVCALDEKNIETGPSSKVFATLLSAVYVKSSGEFSASVGMGQVAGFRSGLLTEGLSQQGGSAQPAWMQKITGLSFVQLANPHLVVHLAEGSFAAFNQGHFSEMGCYFQSKNICLELGIPFSNIGFLEPAKRRNNSTELNAVVYERGAGLTQCCGSGGCAMRVALKAENGSPFPEHLKLKMPGGVVAISESGDELVLTGPAKRIASLQAGF